MLSYFSNPARFEGFARWASPVALVVLFVSLIFAVPMGLYFSPEDYQQGHTVRIMYVHVPAAIMAELVFGFIATMSLTAFVWRHTLADACARAAAGPGAIFAFLTLLTGSIWGRPTWGTWWVWDARLTSMLILFLTYIGYIAVWQMGTDEAKSARLARIVGLVGFINVPIVKFSVEWWNTLHQPTSILKEGGPSIHSSMLWPLGLMALAYMALFAWFVLAGVRASIYEKRLARAAQRTASRPIAVDDTMTGKGA